MALAGNPTLVEQFNEMTKKTSMAEIAKKAGVGKTTVSMALRDDPRISLAQRKRVQRIAREMGYQANALVSRLMYELRTFRQQNHQATLALVNCSRSFDARKRFSVFDDWCVGVEQRAKQLGYSVDGFWMHEPGMSPERLQKIFRARNILGVVFFALEGEGVLREFKPVWSRFPCVTVGARVRDPALHFVVNDHFSTSQQAVQMLRGMGYGRIGMIIDEWQNTMLESRFLAGWRSGLEDAKIALPVLPPLLLQGYLAKDPQTEKKLLSNWLETWRPDACLTLNVCVLDYMAELGYRVPKQIGLARLNITAAIKGKVAGMEQRHRQAGMAAVDTLVGQVLRGEPGIPAFQKGILIEAVWSPGTTVRKVARRTATPPAE